ncbi:UNVERIFIED_CONTAM: hypothetical protein RMT77_015500 [Armadillidium vulgare]
MEEPPVIRQIIQVILHRKFTCDNYSNDISLIKMKEPLTRYTSKIIPICLPPSGLIYEGIIATVSGWGAEQEEGRVANILRKTDVSILANFQCNRLIRNSFSEDMICADSFNHQTCFGDSGGPLIINELDKHVQIGRVSFGFGCYATFFPHAYTRLNHYLQWIQIHTSDAFYCENKIVSYCIK